MKKEILALIALCFCATRLFSQVNQPEVVLYSEINLSYKNGFYPGVIEKYNTLKELYPESVFLLPSAVLKGESLVRLNRFEEARALLEKTVPSLNIGDSDYEKACYYLGNAAYNLNSYDDALRYFHECMVACRRESDFEFYARSSIYVARIFYMRGNLEKALPFMEYVVSNGNAFTKTEYEEICQKIALVYNKLSEENHAPAYSQKYLSLFNSFEPAFFTAKVYNSLKLQAAVALENTNQIEHAYEYYCQIIESGIKELAVVSLQKAYVLSKNQPSLQLDTARLFFITENSFADDPSLLCEFWVRLGIDSYNIQNYDDARTYFDSAEKLCNEESGVRNAESVIADLYKCKIELALRNQKNVDLAETEKNLEALKNAVESVSETSSILNISDSYYAVLIQLKAFQEKWQEIPSLYEKILKPDDDVSYLCAAAFFNLKKYNEACTLLGKMNYFLKQDYISLYASSCALAGKTASSEKLFAMLSSRTPEQNLEYAKVLYGQKKFFESLNAARKAAKADLPYGYYLCGLNEINLAKWDEAADDFELFLKKNGNPKKNDDKDIFYNLSATYYAGYACYVTGRFEQAYQKFDACNRQKKVSEFSTDAYEYAAKSALQLKQFDRAAEQAEGYVKSAKSREKEEQAVLFCASVLADGKKYGRAVEFLKPYTQENNAFAAQALMETARIHQKNKDFPSMDSCYEEVVNRFGKDEIAQDALYSCGEAYHAEGEYEKAEEKFGRYIYKYVDGLYAERALYFSGDCNFRLGKLDRSIMLNTRLVSKYTSSIYLYAAYKNLLEADYQLGHYADALKAAEFLEKNFAVQAEAEGITFRISELKKIASGQDSAVAKKSAEFEKNGGLKTAKGRKTGSELVQLYCQSQETEQEGILLALQLLPLQQVNFPAELPEAAVNADLIAGWYRKNGSDKEAAENYLLAAEYYKASSSDTEKTAYSLYCAAEAFSAAGLKADARDTANLLIKLYPESRYSENVVRFR